MSVTNPKTEDDFKSEIFVSVNSATTTTTGDIFANVKTEDTDSSNSDFFDSEESGELKKNLMEIGNEIMLEEDKIQMYFKAIDNMVTEVKEEKVTAKSEGENFKVRHYIYIKCYCFV